jgi:hypothetical protein
MPTLRPSEKEEMKMFNEAITGNALPNKENNLTQHHQISTSRSTIYIMEAVTSKCCQPTEL